MNTDELIFKILENAGFTVLGADAGFIRIEDPACIIRSFEIFAEYAWMAIVFITGILLMGWAIALIRGTKLDGMVSNLRNLILIFGALAAVRPIMNLVYGDDLFGIGCKDVYVSRLDVEKVLNMRDSALYVGAFEELDIYDSGPIESVSVGADNIRPNVVANVNLPSPTQTTNTNHQHEPQTQTMGAISATVDGRDVIYNFADGVRIRRLGGTGTRSWLNTNPGNIRVSEFSRRMGAIGAAGGFAVFPDENTGMNAIKRLLQSESYIGLTIAGAISKYAPPVENDTNAYQRNITQMTGLNINTRMSELTDAELTRVANAIRRIEGWRVGTEMRM